MTEHELAQLLSGLADAAGDDRELAHILRSAKSQIHTLGWNRYTRMVKRSTRTGAMRRRHQPGVNGHAVWRQQPCVKD